MMQVVDRRTAGPLSPSSSIKNPFASPKKPNGSASSPRSPHLADGQAHRNTPSKSTLWSSDAEDSSLARTQQFIIDAYKNPIVFQASEAYVSAEIPYTPINDDDIAKAQQTEKVEAKELDGVSTLSKLYTKAGIDKDEDSSRRDTPASPAAKDLYKYRISLHPPKVVDDRGAGLYNKGNTCYMNSTLQALLHLPPLSHALLTHEEDELYGRLGNHPMRKFDAIEELVALAKKILMNKGSNRPTAPVAFLRDLKLYAPTLTRMRQEDAHEFLRFLLDAFQYCCVLRAPKAMKPNDPLRETTLPYKIFGGKFRSRVQCQRCKHNSDTFEVMLDIGLNLKGASSVKDALENFTASDVLTGSEKYRCEKCKKPVDATKRFTIHEPPVVLTLLLKRFSPSGQKYNRQINYSESLELSRHMLSEGLPPQHYKLRSIVHHRGNSVNSGHYVASVKGHTSQRWYEMNDEVVYPCRGAPVNSSDAYILFYVRDPGRSLDSSIRSDLSIGSKRKSHEADVEERKYKKQNIASSSLLSPTSAAAAAAASSSLHKKSPLQAQRAAGASAVSPSSFYGASSSTASPSVPRSSGGVKKVSPMFRNMNNMSSDNDLDDDDTGVAVPTSLERPKTSLLYSKHALKGKKNKLGIRPSPQGNGHHQHPHHHRPKIIESPFKVGRDNLSKPIHARMRDKHGNNPFR